MANYIGWEITNKGRELIARAVNNETKCYKIQDWSRIQYRKR